MLLLGTLFQKGKKKKERGMGWGERGRVGQGREEKPGQCLLWNLILKFSLFLYADHSGLNFIDLMVRQGNIDNPPKTPLVPGFECSGIVEALGDSVKGYEVVFLP